MKKLKSQLLILIALACTSHLSAQELKQQVSEDEIQYIAEVFRTISVHDQQCRKYISSKTLDDRILAKIDSVFNKAGLKEGMEYQRGLNLSLPEETVDSLWDVQHQLDFQNHLAIRGIWETYGYIPKSLVEEYNYVQALLLVHPPKDWDIPAYQKEYAELLLPEVKAGRMPAMAYASFYDNILCKILRQPQLYGTNREYDAASGQVLPPVVNSLEKANRARAEIGMPLLEEGEYRLVE